MSFIFSIYIFRVVATVKISKARNVIWSSDMSYVAVVSKHCKYENIFINFIIIFISFQPG